MFRATCFMSDDTLRLLLRERPFTTLLATLVAQRRAAADLALSRDDLETAASLEEASAVATHRLGLLEDAMLAILRGRRDGLGHEQDSDLYG
jgi:hypothetical protein